MTVRMSQSNPSAKTEFRAFPPRYSEPGPVSSRVLGGSITVWLVDALVLFLCVAPLLFTAHIPFFDLPNHLARQFVIADLPGSADLQRFYSVKWVIVPNLAIDLFTAAFRHVMSIEAAMRAFCISA